MQFCGYPEGMQSNLSSLQLGVLATTLKSKRREDISDLIAKLRAGYDSEDRDAFQLVVKAATGYGVTPTELADEFAVSTATISRWSRGSVVPSVFVRRHALERLEKLLRSQVK
jgi:ribosome-binding protein aMBF1 (putative translation factor)